MEISLVKAGIEDLRARIAKIRDCLDIAGKQAQRQKLQEQMSRPGFWDNQDTAKAVVSKISALKTLIEPAVQAESEAANLSELFDMAVGENDQQTLSEVEKDLRELEKKCARIELSGTLSGPDDMKNCFFSIHAGAGGTESCDWASMLLRMYTRYFQQNKFSFDQLDLTPGEEAGLRSITLKVSGPFAFGKLSCETGVHRLVRISPFDANKRRHTSFAAVDCLPETEDVDIEIKEDDLKIEFFRSGGAGGQHVNKVSSAVRIVHIPTGVVVQCQNDRSQHRNKAEAMKMLKSRLYMLEQQKRDAELAKIYSSKGEIAWGSQIRSYVLQPYQLVKDHRTDFQTGNVDAVLDGDIEDFIDSYLQFRAEKKHKNK